MYMYDKQSSGDLAAQQGNILKVVGNFKYLGSWIQISQKNMEVRIGIAWNALNKMNRTWK